MDSKILIVFLAIIALSILDVFANIVSFIPIIGDILEGISEIIMETVTIILAGILAMAAGLTRK